MHISRFVFLWMFAAMGAFVFAQEDEPPRREKEKNVVSIVFTPPPMEGVIAMGIFDKAKKLVRVLHREATVEDFKIGLNGLITKWDGLDDAGQPAPAGKYAVRGWTVGDLEAEGVAFHCNDWAGENGPRYSRVLSLDASERDVLRVTARDAEGKEANVGWELSKKGEPEPNAVTDFAITDGKLRVKDVEVVLGEGAKAIAAAAGFGGNVWAIVELPEGREVRAYAPDGEFLRRLGYAPGEPLPLQIGGSQWSDTVFLLDENGKEQRLRALTLTDAEGKPAWKTVYQKRVVFSGTFEAVAAELGRAEPVVAEASVKVTSKPNSLLQNERTEVQLVAKADEAGALLATADGLPLLHISKATGLKWAVIAKEGKSVRVFTGDGAAVAEFEVKRPDRLMEFDAGEYELRR